MSAAAEQIRLRSGSFDTIDRASVLAVDDDETVVGCATVSRLYGARGEIALGLFSSHEVALRLIDGLDRLARSGGIDRVELDASSLHPSLLAALRASRSTRDERRGGHLQLSWSTTHTR